MSIPLPAAAIILEDRYSSGSVYLVKRARNLKFLGGFYAFPGGKVDLADNQLASSTDLWDIALVAAVRELFEETGVLLLRDKQGNSLKSSPELAQIRCDLLEKRITFASLLADNSWQISSVDLFPVGIFTTPAFSPMRFETRFFLTRIPSGQVPEVFSDELEEGVWGNPSDHLKKWYAEEILISPPVLELLEKLNQIKPSDWRIISESGLVNIKEFKLDRIRFASWIEVVSVVCPGPSMAQTGNVYLLGLASFYLLDPGALEASGELAIQSAIQARIDSGDSFLGILLSHHHPDHVASAKVVADLWRVPVFAHQATASRLLDKVKVNHFLNDGDQIPLGFNPFTGSNLVLTAFHTPGHAEGHIVFFEERSKTLFAGDLVSTSTTILISPPDGHLATYLDSIRRMIDMEPELLMPFHGCPAEDGTKVLETALLHREKREAALLSTLLQDESKSLEEIAFGVYRGLPEPLMKLAQRQIFAGLIKLKEEGRVLDLDQRWKLLK